MAKVVKFKFSLGDTVYFMSDNKVSTGILKRIKSNICKEFCNISYVLDTGDVSNKTIEEKNCFSSKAKLLKSL
tara:strand:- start:420 stop:638 length:219 start_codon:yes stop_codon:yes gene_type:complete